MIRVGIVGATGYGSREILRLLCQHPHAQIVAVTSTSVAGQPLAEVLPGFRNLLDLTFQTFDARQLAEQCDVVFVGVPGKESMEPVAALREAGVRVVDIGPDFRLTDLGAFATYYGTDHSQPELLGQRVYGLPPCYRDALPKANLVAVPGCYPISAILPLRPLIPHISPDVPVVIDSISGVSGAGRSTSQTFHFPEMNENVVAYKLGIHQHTPEIEQELDGKVLVQFTPHVGPFTRGILSTITMRLTDNPDLNDIFSCYADEPFVRVLGADTIPDLNRVRGTNFCDFGWHQDDRTGNLILVSAIDNLVGGTAGMAVQCMNLMFGLDESDGLRLGSSAL
jgi:N-acetyl-gamma-glutamyl-phosphate reductase